MLNQAKNEMDNLKDKIQDLKDDNQRLQNNIQKRNAQIAAMGESIKFCSWIPRLSFIPLCLIETSGVFRGR